LRVYFCLINILIILLQRSCSLLNICCIVSQNKTKQIYSSFFAKVRINFKLFLFVSNNNNNNCNNNNIWLNVYSQWACCNTLYYAKKRQKKLEFIFRKFPWKFFVFLLKLWILKFIIISWLAKMSPYVTLAIFCF